MGLKGRRQSQGDGAAQVQLCPDAPQLDGLAIFRYAAGKVPGTCRLQTQVTVKPGTRRHLTLEAFRVVGNAGSHLF